MLIKNLEEIFYPTPLEADTGGKRDILQNWLISTYDLTTIWHMEIGQFWNIIPLTNLSQRDEIQKIHLDS